MSASGIRDEERKERLEGGRTESCRLEIVHEFLQVRRFLPSRFFWSLKTHPHTKARSGSVTDCWATGSRETGGAGLSPRARSRTRSSHPASSSLLRNASMILARGTREGSERSSSRRRKILAPDHLHRSRDQMRRGLTGTHLLYSPDWIIRVRNAAWMSCCADLSSADVIVCSRVSKGRRTIVQRDQRDEAKRHSRPQGLHGETGCM